MSERTQAAGGGQCQDVHDSPQAAIFISRGRPGMIRPPPFRAEHIGSLVRPPELLRAREQQVAGKLDHAALFAIETAAIVSVVKLQEEVGWTLVTADSFRRGRHSDE